MLNSRLGAVYDIIRHKNTRPPLAVAVYGDWGTGKSSAMRWLSDRLGEWSQLSKTRRKDHCRTRTVWFDPWKYTKREDVWRGLIAEVILKAIDVRGASLHTVVSAARKFGLFLGRSFLNILASTELKVGAEAGATGQKISGEAKVDLDALSKIAEDYRQTSHPEKAFLNEFETALREWVRASLANDERMVIFIDDLDRCLPEVVLEVLEALKLYLNIPQLIFVVGLDREVVDAVVRHHYDDKGLGEAKPEHYLDKMFQVEVDIPPSQKQMEGYLEHQIAIMNKVADEYWSDNLTGSNKRYKEVIEEKIGRLAEDNPREVKRLLNSTLLRATAAARHDELGGNEALRFTQGCQVYLMQRVLRKYVPKSATLLREGEALAFFERWSQFIAAHPDFRRPGRRAEDETAEHTSDKREQSSSDDQDYEMLKVSLPRYRDSGEPIPLFDQPHLWDLLAIPFSPDVAAAAVIDSSGKEERRPQAAKAVSRPQSEGDAREAVREAAHPMADMTPTLLSAIARQLDKPVASLQPEDLPQVRELGLAFTDLRNLKPLSALTALQALNLNGAQIKNAELAHLEKLTTLQMLDLEGTQITDAGLAHLQKLTVLKRLYLDDTRITDAGLAHLQKLTALQKLYLEGTQITDAGLAHLQKLTALQKLDLRRTRITGAGLAYLQKLTALQSLSLRNTQITDRGLIHLEKLTALQTLDLRNTQITDAGLAHLEACTELKGLYVVGTKVTQAGEKRLFEAIERRRRASD
ncbi:MAG: P-loop NTPase fold protein [Phycisphaerales bacterium]|nr:P-loop NTPase fold protein [Phycisphaerales bacterium]